MEKIKSRWRKNYLEGDIINNDEAKDENCDTGHHHHHHNNINNSNAENNSTNNNHHHKHHHHHHRSKHSTPPTYEPLVENVYLDKRKNEHSRNKKEARSMVCDCILTKEERARGVMGCLDDCLNRMLMIECGPKCTLGEHCLNKRFQKRQSAKVEVFKTKKKGWGLRTTTELPAGSFIMEYVGEVVRSKEFRSRIKKYTKQKVKHHYFMALRSDEIIDATCKGNLTRFINHSCEPNCETQKWTVNGELRIGFFTIKDLQPGEEITFDYQFQRYGRKAQKCYCETPSCRGYIGGSEQTFSLNGHSSPQLNENKAHKKAYKHGLLVDVTLEDKINALAEAAARGLKTKDQVIALASLSIKAEEVGDRRKLLEIIRQTKSEFSLRLFIDYHGLEIICLWMRDPQADCDFKATIIEILERLPIPNKTKVIESNVYRMVERWATEEPKAALQPTSEVNSAENSNSIDDKRSRVDDDEQIKDGEENEESKDQLTKPNILDENSDSRPPNQSKTTRKPLPPDTSLPQQQYLNQQNPNSPNIKALANRLLKKFQALSPGFKIPRLNRLQRKEIETKMVEEEDREDSGNKDKSSNEINHPFARGYFKSSTTNGLISNATPKTNTQPLKRKFDSLSTNNIDLTPAPKISKEEHRQQFEMHVRLKDYYDTIERQFGPAAVEQIKLTHCAFPSLNGLPLPYPHLVAGQNLPYLSAPCHPLASLIPPPLVVGAWQPAPAAPPPPTPTPTPTPTPVQPAPITQAPPILSDIKPGKPEPTNLPTLIVLANHSIEPSYAIDDELAFSICDYDEYYSLRDKPLDVGDLIDKTYPYPGTYYTTPDGETWFATVTLDRKTQKPRTVILNLHSKTKLHHKVSSRSKLARGQMAAASEHRSREKKKYKKI